MGTRADFYIKKAEEQSITWIGSIAWDGYPDGIDKDVLMAKNEADFITALQKFMTDRTDVTLPERGWPWPWDDSRTTDYSYIFQDGKVMCSNFGYPLFDPLAEVDHDGEDEDQQKMEGFFPDMSSVKNVRFDKGSGIIIVQG